jgi:hypothetical protein
MPRTFKRIEVGEESGDLVVVGRVGMRGKAVLWGCRCKLCGAEAILTSTTFRRQKACAPCARARGALARVKHGDTIKSGPRSSLYGIWQAMRNRCNNPASRGYRWYGAKGITVCLLWRNYIPFREWAIANGFVPGMSIDRKDSTKPYEPDNCQWVTKSQNSKTMRETYVFVRRPQAEAGLMSGMLGFGA